MITLIISNEEIKDIMKIVKSLEVSDLLVNVVTEAIENEAKEQKDMFFDLLCTLGARFLEIFYQVNELSELAKEQVEQTRLFSSTSSSK